MLSFKYMYMSEVLTSDVIVISETEDSKLLSVLDEVNKESSYALECEPLLFFVSYATNETQYVVSISFE